MAHPQKKHANARRTRLVPTNIVQKNMDAFTLCHTSSICLYPTCMINKIVYLLYILQIMFKLAIWNSRDFISLRLLLRQKWKNTHCTQNEKNIALVSWSVWHLPLLTFVFCGFSLTAVGKVKSQLFYITRSPAALIYTTGWDGMHLQDAFTYNSKWGCLCEKEFKSTDIIWHEFEKECMSIFVCWCFVVRTLLRMSMMGPKPLKHRGRRRLHKQVGFWHLY